MNEEIKQTLIKADNEGTSAPYWLIIDPSPISNALMWEDGNETIYASIDEWNVERIVDGITSCITGPFFCREDEER